MQLQKKGTDTIRTFTKQHALAILERQKLTGRVLWVEVQEVKEIKEEVKEEKAENDTGRNTRGTKKAKPATSKGE